MGSNGMMILIVLVLAFLLVLVLVALFMAALNKKNKAIPIYVDEDGQNNIMPYNDEGLSRLFLYMCYFFWFTVMENKVDGDKATESNSLHLLCFYHYFDWDFLMISIFPGAGEDDFENYDLEKLLMHTGGRNLVFMDEYQDEANAALARASANKASINASAAAAAVGGTAMSNVAVSGGNGFAGAASALFGASTKSQYIQAEGKSSLFLFCLMFP